jgi:nucleoside-diphosphate-sugar epimerase
MANLFCFGLGYSAARYVADFGAGYERIVGTVRSPERAAALAAPGLAGHAVDALIFDGRRLSEAVCDALAAADFLLISAPPDLLGDSVLAVYADALVRSTKLRSIVYLSSISVYGNYDGVVIDESMPTEPITPRGKQRLAAEIAWKALGLRIGVPVAIVRLSGIYGPNRNVLISLARGEARNVVKPGQVFNRIHVADVARSIEASFSQLAAGVFNVTDDEPAPRQDVLAYAASLMGLPVPPEIPYAEAQASMTIMARSFYQDNKRIGNQKLKSVLGVNLIYPTYREGLRALFNDDAQHCS